MWIQRSIPLAAAALVGAGAGSWRRVSRLFEWNGRVDREIQIVMRGNQVWTRRLGATEPGWARARTIGDLPRQDGVVRVQVMHGRGNVAVIQQPNAQNHFTTVVRIQDPQSGSDHYRLVGYLEGYSNGELRRLAGPRPWTRSDNYPGNNGGYADRDNGGYGDRGNGRRATATARCCTGAATSTMKLEVRIQNGRVTSRTLRGRNLTNARVRRGQHGHAPR